MSDTATKWRQRVAGWRASGETAAIYSSRHGFTTSSLRYWASRLRREDTITGPMVRLAQVVRTPLTQRDEAPRGAVVIERERRVAAEAERDRLREAYEALKIQVELAHRRLVIAKAERIDTTQLELEFATKLAELDQLAGLVEPEPGATGGEGNAPRDKPRRRRGRRCDLHKVVGEERIELLDPIYEGKFERMGVEETSKLKWRRGGLVRVVIARLKYRTAPSAAVTVDQTSPAADQKD